MKRVIIFVALVSIGLTVSVSALTKMSKYTVPAGLKVQQVAV